MLYRSIKAGKIYKIRKGSEKECGSYSSTGGAEYIKITKKTPLCLNYGILNAVSERQYHCGAYSCAGCFKPTHTEKEIRS
jgi:hypothetical protein